MTSNRDMQLPSGWTASQCAGYRGVSRQQWLDDVRDGLEPPDIDGSRLWRAVQVRAWIRPDEWLAAECAAHHGISLAQWNACVRQNIAPAPARQVGRRSVWRRADVKGVVLQVEPKPVSKRRVPKVRKGPDPQATTWTAAQCADYHGISTSAWRAAVRRGDAPRPASSEGASQSWIPALVIAVNL